MISLLKKTRSQVQNRLLNWLVLFFAASLIVGCNNNADTQASVKDTTDTTGSGGVLGAAMADIKSKLEVLYMDKTQFETLWPPVGGQTKKWVFKHSLASGKLTFTVWPEKSQKYTDQTVTLQNLMETTEELKDGVIFGDQKLTKAQVTTIKNQLPTGNYLLFFVPKIEARVFEGKSYNVLHYEVRFFDSIAAFKTAFSNPAFATPPLADTNPSPPANSLE